MTRTISLLVLTLLAAPAFAEAPPLAATARLPVKEVTVFKDGHALLLHEGRLPVDADGTVTLDYLPNPVLGTFWPSSGEKDAPLTSVTAARRRVSVPHTAVDLHQLLEANIGAEVIVT